jgi:hypothetical protein
LARCSDFQRQTDAGLPHLPLGEQQSLEIPLLLRSDVYEGYAVPDASAHGSRVLGPDHSRLNIDGALVRLKTHPKRNFLFEFLGQLYAGPAHAHITAPTHSHLATP